MPRKRFTPEQIIIKLREAEVLLGKGKTVAEVCRRVEITENTYYRWRKEYGGLDIARERECPAQEAVGREGTRYRNSQGGRADKFLSPARRRQAVEHTSTKLRVSERRTCRVLEQPRSTQRYEPRLADDEVLLTERIIALAREYGRYGYQRITALLRTEGWHVNHKRVARIWRQEGLRVPRKQPKRRRLWLCDGSCVRRRPEHPNHVWAYDFVHECTHEGRTLRMLTVVDEYTRECLAIEVSRKLNSQDVIRVLTRLFVHHGTPEYLRSDNGPELTAVESFNGKLRDELLKGEIFYTVWEAKVLVERWRRHYNGFRPHSSLGYKPLAPEAVQPQPMALVV
ncbi:MAG: IS3 family transposase [Planctomycetota bacterium]|jgi:transposase InsO family protein